MSFLLLAVPFSLEGSAALAWKDFPGGRAAKVQPPGAGARAGFTMMGPTNTGVIFSNRLDDVIVPKNQNLMLGSGVAVGDFDGDGWCDLYFCALTRGNALYRNRGDWRFEDVTKHAGVALAATTNTGAVFADIDGDGRLDLLVSSLGNGVRLLRNETNGTFRDVTAEAGLTSHAGSMSMAVGDVDGDGDLDLFVCNYGAQAIVKAGVNLNIRMVNGRPEIRGPNAERLRIANGKLVELGEPPVLYLNDGGGKFHAAEWGTERFLDEDGKPMEAPWDFGLSAQMRDVNGDGAPDIYVCNDFDTPDRFWLNDSRGHFRLAPRRTMRCQSYASMGVDFADLDRDGHLDFLVVEMLATGRARRLWQMNPLSAVNYVPSWWSFRPEVPRNTLLHARGDGTFDEIAHYAGLAASDWSWQGSFLDVDLDGYEDLLVVNGHLFDVQDLDVPPPRSNSTEDIHVRLLRMPRLFTPNRSWRNRGDLTFEETSAAWNFADTNICHGLALADLDNDGDLDVIVNRMNAPALLLRNESGRPRVTVHLQGKAPNTRGIGAKVTLRGGAVPAQMQEMISGGKYLSCDEAARVFAASTNTMELEVEWRSGAHRVISNVQPNCIYEIAEAGGTRLALSNSAPKTRLWFTDTSARLNHTHLEPAFDDFELQPLLTRKLSQRGPGICVTDLDGDGHEDLVIGAGRGGRVSFYKGDGRGGFAHAASSEPLPEDALALVPWTSQSGKRGVLCSFAQYETKGNYPPLLLLKYQPDQLVFDTVTESVVFPDARSVSHCVAVADFDGDGGLDVFLGSHAVPGHYPESASSMLLRQERGLLRPDLAHSNALGHLGLVNSALWSDLNGDGWPELIVACEWGPVRIFKNDRGQLTAWNPVLTLNAQPSTLDELTGWWTGLAAADFDNDGRMDFVAANWGLNSAERATTSQPLRLYFGDCLTRNVTDLFEAEYDDERPEPMPARRLSEMAPAVPVLARRFRTHHEWAVAPVRTIVREFQNVRECKATTLATMLFLNRGDRLEARPLPAEAQWAPVWSVVANDFDGDGNTDLFLAQNFSATRVHVGPVNGGRGLLLRGNGQGGFTPVKSTESGLTIDGDQRGAATGDFDEDGGVDLVVGQNGGATSLFHNANSLSGARLRVTGETSNPNGIGTVLQLFSDGKLKATREIQGGSGWLSHNSAVVQVPALQSSTNAELRVRWPRGRETHTPFPTTARHALVQPNGSVLSR